MKEFEIENGILKAYHGDGSNVVIPEGVTEIGEDAFENCDSLVAVTVPNSVKKIGAGAFDGCENLASVTMSGNTLIGARAFNDCPCEEDVLDARKTIRLDPIAQIYVWDEERNWWDGSIETDNPDTVTLNCTMAELLAEPATYLKEIIDESDLEDTFFECYFGKDDVFHYEVEFYDSYYGHPPYYCGDPVVTMKYALPDDWKPDCGHDKDGTYCEYDEDGDAVYFDEEDKPFYRDGDGDPCWYDDDGNRFYKDDDGNPFWYDEDGDKFRYDDDGNQIYLDDEDEED